MEEMFGTNYYTVGLPVILGLIIAAYIGASILWNKKWVPMRRSRGIATPYFGNTFSRITKFAFSEDPRNIAPKKVTNKWVKRLFTLRTINWMLLLASFAMLGLKNENAWVPALILVLVVWIQTAKPLAQRDRILQRMFAVASSGFRYGRGSELNPWGFVRIKKWENLTTPGETHVSIPANWDASSIPARDGFESHFNTTVTDSNSWIYEWKSADGTVICRPISHLPEMATYPGSEKHPWNVIPLGLGTQGEVTVDLTKTPHMLICGSTGSGKSVLQRNLVFHCIQHNDMWRFLGVDVKRVELTPFKRYSKTVLGIGANLEDGVEIVRYAKEVMETRYEEMEAKGVNHFKDLTDEDGKPPYAVMLMVDEAFMFMSVEGAKTDEGKMRDQLHGEASVMLGEIARLGRASGVHLVLATQRPDATVIRGELKANLDIRIAAGRLDATPSSMVLDSGAATQLPGHIKGRGIVRFGGEQEQFQGYFADQDWIEEWLQAHPGVEPELYPADGVGEVSSLDDELEALSAGYDFDDGEITLNGKEISNSISDVEIEQQEAVLDAPLGAPGVTPPVIPMPTAHPEEQDDLLSGLGEEEVMPEPPKENKKPLNKIKEIASPPLIEVPEDLDEAKAAALIAQFYGIEEPIIEEALTEAVERMQPDVPSIDTENPIREAEPNNVAPLPLPTLQLPPVPSQGLKLPTMPTSKLPPLPKLPPKL